MTREESFGKLCSSLIEYYNNGHQNIDFVWWLSDNFEPTSEYTDYTGTNYANCSAIYVDENFGLYTIDDRFLVHKVKPGDELRDLRNLFDRLVARNRINEERESV